jgi:hypothetical protein
MFLANRIRTDTLNFLQYGKILSTFCFEQKQTETTDK